MIRGLLVLAAACRGTGEPPRAERIAGVDVLVAGDGPLVVFANAATPRGLEAAQSLLARAKRAFQEVYTTLTAGGTYQFRDQANLQSREYGGAEGELEGCGPAITTPETGQYRVTVNLNDNTYELLHIDRWSLGLDMRILARTAWAVVSGTGS